VFNGSFTSEEFTRIKKDKLATLCKFDKIKQKYIMYVQQLQGSSGSTQDPLLFSRDQQKKSQDPWPLITKENNVHWKEMTLKLVARTFSYRSTDEVIACNNVFAPEGLAINSVRGSIYWTNEANIRM